MFPISELYSSILCLTALVRKNYLSTGKKEKALGPGQVGQSIRAPSWHAKVVGSIPGQGT